MQYNFLWQVLFDADPLVQIVMLLLISESVIAWTIAYKKWSSLKKMKASIAVFEGLFLRNKNLEEIHKKIKGKEDNPISYAFSSGMQEIEKVGGINACKSKKDPSFNQTLQERLYHAMEATNYRSLEEINHGISILAIIKL